MTASEIKEFNSTDLARGKSSLASILGCDTCVEKNEPSPFHLVTHRVQILLQLIHRCQQEPKEKKRMHISLIKATLHSCDEVNAAGHPFAEATVRSLELQVLLRLQYWATLGKSFAALYRKLNLSQRIAGKETNRRKQKSNSNSVIVTASQYLLRDIIDLFTMVALKLPHDQPFPLFLRSCLYKSFSSQLPKNVYPFIFDHFEVVDSQTMETEEAVQFTQLPLPRRKKKKLTLAKNSSENFKLEEQTVTSDMSNANTAATAINETAGKQQYNSLLAQPIRIMAPVSRTKNSLFVTGSARGQRSQFVRSHFNSSLTNTSSLFREVKAVQKYNKPTANSNFRQKLPTTENTSVASLNNRKGAKQQMITSTYNSKKRKARNIFQSSIQLNKRQPIDDAIQSQEGNLGLDAKSARRVMAAARNALKRQS